MKHKFLEIAGIENEEQFYKKFPTEQSFFDAFRHANFGGEEPLKAMSGIHINPANKGKFNATKQKTGKSTKELTHSKNPITKKRAIFAQNAAKWNKAQGGLNVPKQEDFPDYESFQSAMDAYLYSSGLSNNDQPQQQSRRINFGTIPKQEFPQLQNIGEKLSNTSINTNKGPNVPVGEASGLSKAMPYINAGMDVIKGIQQLAAEKKQVKKAKTWAGVTGAQALASQTREQPINRKYVRPEDMIFQPEQLNVPYGAGTNYLAQYGTSIPKAESGSSMIGKGIGTAAGTAIFGPVGGMVGGWVGGTIGELVDPNAAKIEAYEEQQTNNLNTVMGQNFAQGIQGQYSAFMERGGNIPSKMESNGELRTYGRGNISPISYNPFLPDGGETIMFEGPPHGKGGMPITYGQNPVEVEGGEPALKLSDGGQMGGDNLVVFGDLTIPKGMLDDVKAKGKFKTYIKSLSEKENIYNKLSEKASEGMNGLSVYSPYDKLKENSFKMNWEGANAKLKRIAEKKQNAGFLQGAINSTAEEGGLDANSLSRGIIKPEKAMSTAQYGGMFGKELVKAQDGYTGTRKGGTRKVDPRILKLYDMLENKGYDMKKSSGVRPGATTKQGKPSRHGLGEALDVTFPTLDKDAYDTILKDEEIVQYMRDNGITAINEYNTDVAKNTDASGPHIHFGFDKGTATSDQFRNDSAIRYPNMITRVPQSTTDKTKITPQPPPQQQSDQRKMKLGPPILGDSIPLTPEEVEAEEGRLTLDQYNELNTLYEKAKKQKRGDAVTKFQERYHKYLPNEATEIIQEDGNITSLGKKRGLTIEDLKKGELRGRILNSNEDGEFGKRTIQYRARMDKLKSEKDKIQIDVPVQGAPYDFFPIDEAAAIGTTAPVPNAVPAGTPTETTTISAVDPNKRAWWMDAFNQMLPHLRPTDTEELDPRQLMGEMFALSNNQLEPVKAQTYQPQLQSPYDISLQEIMNQNQADFNATQRLVGDNPAALAALNAQKYGANEKVLGEQFRVNQANKANIYSDNIKTLNDAQLKNLAIYDEQFVRQEKAKSITKATTQTAFSDISDKYSKNKLRNRELATYQNLYNYRYDDRFRAMNMNPLQQWNTELGFPSQQGGLGTPPTGYEWGPPTLRKLKDKDDARNGAIVKALKLI